MKRALCIAFLCICAAVGSIATAMAADTAVLTIAPDKTAVTADGKETTITYTITVTPPAGKEIGVFSFRLKPSGNMVLPTQAKENGKRVISLLSPELEYDQNEDTGIFRTYEYTPESCFFAAVGTTEGHRMTEAAQVMSIVATVPAGSTGAYVLDAEFTVAPDGSGETYIGKVDTTPVTISAPGGSGSTGGDSTKTVIISGQDEPVSGEMPDREIQINLGGTGTAEKTVKWYCDGSEIAEGTAFAPGHTYTIEIRVKTTDGTFDTQVYVNSGYTVERVSDTEILLRRSYYVEEAYTQSLTEEEAQSRPEQAEAEDGAPQSAEDISAVAKTTAGENRAASPIVPIAVVIGILAAAAIVCQVAVPGGLRSLIGRRKSLNQEANKDIQNKN